VLRKGRHPSRLAELVIGPATSGRTRWLAPQGNGTRAKHDAGSCSITMIRAAERRTMDQITNQPPPLEPYNLLQTDRALCSALVRDKAGWAADELAALGKTLGEPETIRLGFAANAYPPVLRAFDRTVIASTKSNFILPGTHCFRSRSKPDCMRVRGRRRARVRMSLAPPALSCWRRSKAACTARSR